MSGRCLKLLVLGCAVLASAACTGSAETTTLPSVPEITNELDAEASAPCLLLTRTQAGELGLDSGRPGRTDLGAQCVWRTEQVTLALTRYVHGGGLAAMAGSSDPAAARVRVEGYPALETFTAGGRYCRYDVGVSEQQVIVATMEGGEPSSCAALQQVLGYVLENLPSH